MDFSSEHDFLSKIEFVDSKQAKELNCFVVIFWRPLKSMLYAPDVRNIKSKTNCTRAPTHCIFSLTRFFTSKMSAKNLLFPFFNFSQAGFGFTHILVPGSCFFFYCRVLSIFDHKFV
jgi:hypothetical protein